jgi:hypothetical protein
MIVSAPGLRYERLLFWSAPITFATLMVFLVAAAFDTQKDRVIARCYISAADILTNDLEALGELWPSKVMQHEYEYAVSIFLISKDVDTDCFRILEEALFGRSSLSPEEVISKFQEDAKKTFSAPLEFYGVEIPDKATINIFGTKINIGLMSFVQTLQLALTPILLLWLGSLYHTRLREILSINLASELIDVFPHVINIFPVGHFPDLRKKNWIAFHAPKMVGLLFFIVRISFLMIFVGPPIIFYILSLYFLPIGNYFFISYFLGSFVIMVGFGIFVIEATIFWKVFPGPAKLR